MRGLARFGGAFSRRTRRNRRAGRNGPNGSEQARLTLGDLGGLLDDFDAALVTDEVREIERSGQIVHSGQIV